MSKRVLIVDDEPRYLRLLEANLRTEGYEVATAQDGVQAVDIFSSQPIDLILLDIMMPRMDGFSTCQRIREYSNVPIIMLTAKGEEQDRVRGLDLGADDYLVKPFDLKELLARLRAVTRRLGGQASAILGNGRISLNTATHEAKAGDMVAVLTAREFALLQALLLRPGTILGRTELEERIYGWGEEVESNAVDFLIHSVRRKLGSDVIKNVRGAGWLVEKSG